MKARALGLLLFCAIAGCTGSAKAPRPTPAPSATSLLDSKGFVMTLQQARAQIAFAPVIPAGELLGVAVIPPLGGHDSRAGHGIAMEYEKDGSRLVLSQWQRLGLRIVVAQVDVVHRPCAPIAFKADGLLWASRNGLVLTLQPDGAAPGPLVGSEARRLTRISCFSRSQPRRRFVSSHRQSAS